MDIPALTYVRKIDLQHTGDCYFLGAGENGSVFVEEIYGDEGWLCQSAYTLDGTCIASVDEDYGRTHLDGPISGLDQLAQRQRGWFSMPLNFSGPRHRGMREPERLQDVVKPMSIEDRITAAQHLNLSIPAPMIVGLAESYVIAEARLSASIFFVCRRLRIAYALAKPEEEVDGLPYDYDTLLTYAGHFYEPSADRDYSLTECLRDLALDPQLIRPMDCLFEHDHLWVADGGDGAGKSAIHVWKTTGSEILA